MRSPSLSHSPSLGILYPYTGEFFLQGHVEDLVDTGNSLLQDVASFVATNLDLLRRAEGNVAVQEVEAQFGITLIDGALTVGRHLLGDFLKARQQRRGDRVHVVIRSRNALEHRRAQRRVVQDLPSGAEEASGF